MAEELVWGPLASAGGPPGGLHPEPRMGVAANMDGHLEVFAYAFAGDIWHAWQVDGPNSTAQSKWSDWASLGHPPANGTTFETDRPVPIQVIQGENNKLDVFVLGKDRAIWHISQTSLNGGWGGWESLGAPETVGLDTGYRIAVALNPQHETEVILCDQDGTVFTKAQTDWSGTPTWAANWTSLSHPNLPAPVFKSIALASYGVSAPYHKGALEVIALGTGLDNLWHNVRPGLTANPWSGWKFVVQTAPTPVPPLVTIEAVARNTLGMEFIGIAANGDLWHTWQVLPGTPDNWSGEWDNFGQPEYPLDPYCNFDALMDSDNAFHVAGLSTSGAPVERVYQNNEWTEWQFLREFIGFGPHFATHSQAILKQNKDKLLSFFCVSANGEEVLFLPQEVSTV